MNDTCKRWVRATRGPGDDFYRLRAGAGMSRKEVAKLFCVAVSTVYRWECGEVPMLVQRHARLIFAEFERDVRAKMEAIDRDYEATREQREPAARLVALSHDI